MVYIYLPNSKRFYHNTHTHTGENNFIALGVCHSDYPNGLLPGWEATSIAFHTDEGSLFHSSDEPQPLNQPCSRGDVLKCSITSRLDDDQNIDVQFSRNGERFISVQTPVPPGGFYGIVGLMSKGEAVQISPPMATIKSDFDQFWNVCTDDVVKHHGDGVCSYTGPGDFSENSIGTVRGKAPIDPLGAVTARSFEIRIINPGDKQYIAIGVVSRTYAHNLLPGWEETSVGYHADNGNLFHSCGDGQPTDHPCSEGDIMKCTVEPIDGSAKQVRVLFHRNGQLVGQVTAWSPESGLYACFGMMSKREKVQVVLETTLPYAPAKLKFDEVWQVVDTKLQQHRGDGTCFYLGNGGAESVGTIRSRKPIDPFSVNNRFEVKILNGGRHCYIALGVCSASYSLTALPGWEELSVGFHTDNGMILQSSAGEQATSNPCGEGDVIRCTVEPVDGSHKQLNIIFHRNGNLVGKVIFWSAKDSHIFAQIGCMSIGEVIQIASPQMEPSTLKPDAALPEESISHRHYTAPVGQPMKRKLHSSLTPSESSPQQYLAHQHSEGDLKEMQPPPMEAYYGRQASEGSVMPPHPYYHHHRHPPPHHYPPPYMGHRPRGYQYPPFHHDPYYHHRPYNMPQYFDPRAPDPSGGDALASMAPEKIDPGQLYPPWHNPQTNPESASPLSLQSAASSTRGGSPLTSTQHLEGSFTPKKAAFEESKLPLKPLDFAKQVSVSSSSVGSETAAKYDSQSSLESPSEPGEVISRGGGVSSSFNTEGGLTMTQVHEQPTLEEETNSPKIYPSSSEASTQFSVGRPHSAQTADDAPEKSTGKMVTGKDEPDFEPILKPKIEEIATVERREVFESTPPEDALYPLKLSPAKFPLPQPVANTIPKSENHRFQILQDVTLSDATSSLEYSPGSDGIGFILSRQPLTEKMPYFEVEIQEMSPDGDLLLGLVWDHYPTTHLPGFLQGSIALHSQTGSLHTGRAAASQERVGKRVIPQCTAGDVIGFRALLQYKSEYIDPTTKDHKLIKVEVFKNGCLVASEGIFLSPSGFFPAVGFSETPAKVKLSHNANLTPETYFQTHPLPEDFLNFPPPETVPGGFRCLQNAKLTNNLLTLEKTQPGHPAVVQSNQPFSQAMPYFEIELIPRIYSFSVLSIGALPFAEGDVISKTIPGEAPNSIGYLPLLGFIMMNGSICSTIPQTLCGGSQSVKIGVGIDFDEVTHTSSSSSSLDGKMKLFFTINGQQAGYVFTLLPKGGLHPTLAVDCDSRPHSDTSGLASLRFPLQGPRVKGLPFGFVRGEENGFFLLDNVTVIDRKGTDADLDSVPVRTLQAAFPLSPTNSYFEIRIVGGGESYRISCGLAAHDYSLIKHPGWDNESIAFHADDGKLFCNGKSEKVAPPCRYNGVVLGCGIRFPEDGNTTKCAEVFFTVNQKMVAKRFVSVPQLGFFPTVGMRTKSGRVGTNLSATDPFPDMAFYSNWNPGENVKLEHNEIQLIVSSKPGSLQVSIPLSVKEPVYFKFKPLSEKNGKIMVGITTSKDCSQAFARTQSMSASVIDITTGMVILCDQFIKSRGTCAVEQGLDYGCGLQPLEDKHLLFFTANDQMIYCSVVEIGTEFVYPCVFLMSSTTRLAVDLCALWPNTTAIGRGWARFANVEVDNSKIVHSSEAKRRVPVGFIQASVPLLPSRPYYEIEVCSRAVNKAIAIGLASKRYATNNWVGWKQESIAYHLDDGKLFKVSNLGHSFGPKVFAGHTVGCGVRFGKPGESEATFVDHSVAVKGGEVVEVFFTINGALIGTQKMTISCGGLFPTICLESSSESFIFNTFREFPPVGNMVGRQWINAYCVQQVGMLLQQSCRHKEISGGTKSFCQAKDAITPENPYFEIEIAGCSDASQIQMGVSPLIPKGVTSPNTDSVVYSSVGHILTRKGSHKMTSSVQRSGLGDRIGCSVAFVNDKPKVITFYLNNMKLTPQIQNIPERLLQTSLYPTIVLTRLGDSVLPLLHQPLPKFDHSSLIGWLRYERVRIQGSVLSYTSQGNTDTDVGVAQINQALHPKTDPYFEIEVLQLGTKGTIAIGAASADYRLNSHPGWMRDSIGYHGDDGRLFQHSETGGAFGPTWKTRDVIGLGVRSPDSEGDLHYGSDVQVFFTINGQEIGHSTQKMPASGLFPTIGLHSPGEMVKVNVGAAAPIPRNSSPTQLAWRIASGLKITKSKTTNGRSHILEFNPNGRRLNHAADGGLMLSVGIFGTRFSENMQYFEVEIIALGEVGIAIGVSPGGCSIDKAPGWNTGSIGYHTDDGGLYHSASYGKVFGPVPHRGDTIGCGVTVLPNDQKQCSVFFTHNGSEIGRAKLDISPNGIFPAIALTDKNDKVAVEFCETYKPRFPQSEFNFVGLMRINNCSYSDLVVQFSGVASGHGSSAMAMFAMPLHKTRNYFTANIVKLTDTILIGLAVKDYPMKYAPGFTSVSVAYDIEKGNIRAIYNSDNHYNLRAPVCKKGDTIGCGIELSDFDAKTDQAFVFFTVNDAVVKKVLLMDSLDDLFPVVGFLPNSKSSAVFMDWNVSTYTPRNVL